MIEALLQTDRPPTVAVVGAAKNSGKTTTLNWLLERAIGACRSVGVVSIGVDGEEVDALSGRDKPTVWLPSGHLLAAAASAFARSESRFEFLRQLGFSTPLGKACVGRTLDAGRVVAAGMRHRRDVVRARDAMIEHGAEIVFVDGAYGRSMAADGRLADGVILSTGAVAGKSPERIVEVTRPLVEKNRLEPPDSPEVVSLGERAIADGALLGRVQGRTVDLEEASALAGLERTRREYGHQLESLALPGAVTDRVVDELLAFPDATRQLVVASPASLQTGTGAWSSLRESPWTVGVVHPVRLLGITANPVAGDRRRLSAEALLEALGEAFPERAVVDPVAGLASASVAPRENGNVSADSSG